MPPIDPISKGESGSSARTKINAVIAEVNAKMPTSNQKAAMDGANSPTALNPFATMADLGGGGSPTPEGYSIFVDDLFGDDSTGTPYDSSKPFKTGTAATAIASPGDAIVFQPSPNPYTDVNLGLDNVRYHFKHGASMQSNGNCFNDSGSYNFQVTGWGQFSSTSSVVFSSGSGQIIFQGISAIGTGVGSRTFWVFGDGTMIVNLSQNAITVGQEQVVRVDGEFSEFYMVCNKWYGLGGLLQTGTSCDSAKVYVHLLGYAQYDAYGNGYVALNLVKGDIRITGGAMYFNGDGLYGTPAVWQSGASSLYVEGPMVFADMTDTAMYFSNPICTGKFDGRIDHVSQIIFAGGTQVFNDRIYSTGVALPTVYQQGGDVTFYKGLINLDTDATSYPFFGSGGGTTKFMQTCTLYSAGSAPCAFASSPKTVISMPGVVANNAKDASITEQVVAILDDPNVIP